MLAIYFLAKLGWVSGEIYLSHVRTRGRRTKEEITKSSHFSLLFSLLLITFLLLRDCYSYYYCLINRTIFPVLDFLWLWFSFHRMERIKRRICLLQHLQRAPQRTLFGIWSVEKTWNLDIFFIFCTFVYFYFFYTFHILLRLFIFYL